MYTQAYYPFSKKWAIRKQKIIEKYSMPNLLLEVESPSAVKREKAAELLSRFIKGNGVKAALEGALDDPSPSVRNSAIKSLMGYKNSSRLQEVVKNMGEVSFADSDSNVRILARVLCSSRDSVARAEAAVSLGNLKNPRSLSVLQMAGKRDANIVVHKEIQKAIKKIKYYADK